MAQFSLMVSTTIAHAFGCAATDPGRFALHGVRLGSDGSVTSTDGRIMLIARMTVENMIGQPGSVILPVDCVPWLKSAARGLPKPMRNSPCVQVTVDGVNVTMTVPGSSATFRAIDGSFPDCESVIPQQPADLLANVEGPRGMINFAYLAELTKAMYAVCVPVDDRMGVEFTYAGPTKPIRLDFRGQVGNAIGVIMPIQHDAHKAAKAKRDEAMSDAAELAAATGGV